MEYVLEDLGVNNLKILQKKTGYHFTSDAVILANFISCKKSDTVVEFGCGSAIISTLIAYKENPKQIYGIEIQNEVYNMAQESIKLNGFDSKITLFEGKIQDALKFINNEVDIVVCNPPYLKKNSGKVANNLQIAISKSELEITIEEIIISAKSILKDGGKFYVCFAPDRLSELMYLLKTYKLEPKRMFFSQADITKSPSCVFIECVKGANAGVKVMPPLITHNDKGDYVATIRNLYLKG